jgi:chemotaxis protein MotA
MDITPILAIVMALGMILGGNAIEGGHLSSLLQPTAAIIVIGGTIGATWLGATPAEVRGFAKLLPRLVKPGGADKKKLMEDMVKVVSVARREGMLAVEGMLPQIGDAFLRRGLRMLVDGHSGEDVEQVLELEMEVTEHHGSAASKLMVDAGGYFPTVGILGAVLGLIHVMQNLADPTKLGTGIAVAFVATIYGVGAANLVCLPMGARLKKIVLLDSEAKAMVLTGLKGIAAGANARHLEELLTPYVGHAATPSDKAAA